MKKLIFDMITSQLSIFKDPLYNYIAMTFIGAIAYIVAFRKVGNLGLRGEAGSIAHWTIRIVVFFMIWFACCIIINLIKFIIYNWITIVVCIIMALILYIMKKYAEIHPDSFLNKKIL